MLETQRDTCNETLRAAALQIMTAARTAPKACGVDNLEIALVTGDELKRLAERLKELAGTTGRAFFTRDAGNLLLCEAVVLIGTHNAVLNLNCGLCGFPTCLEKIDEAPAAPCAFNTHDLGIAVGSAVALAADLRIDCRVMYSAGVAAQDLGLLNNCHAIMAIPLSAWGKSPFFDRPAL